MLTLEEVNSFAVGESGVPIGRGLYGGMEYSPTGWYALPGLFTDDLETGLPGTPVASAPQGELCAGKHDPPRFA